MKRIKFLIAFTVITMILTISAIAATANFSGYLPANQGDTEISTVARLHDFLSYKYFTIKITSLGSGYTSARAWTESGLGTNLSSPYTEVTKNVLKNISYYTNYVPYPGVNVTLNLDNPVYTSSTVSVAGYWTPN